MGLPMTLSIDKSFHAISSSVIRLEKAATRSSASYNNVHRIFLRRWILLLTHSTTRRKCCFAVTAAARADAQHLATEFVIRLSPLIKRPGLPAIALTTDSSMLTAGANDLGYDNVFTRSMKRWATKAM